MSHFLDKEQPAPVANDGPDCWKLVLEDMEHRRQNGIAKYGLPVLPFNGRNSLRDTFEEVLDMCVYLRQAIEEMEGQRQQLYRALSLLFASFAADNANGKEAIKIIEDVLVKWPVLAKEGG